MYGDSRALLSPDSTPIFPSNSKPKVEEIAKFDMNMNNQANSGLLRFRSAPSSLFANIPNGADKGSDSIEGFLNHRPSSPELASPNLIPQRFRDLNSQLPPHYPRHISGSENQLGAMDGLNRFGSSVGQAQMGSTLMRQSSSPAGLFSHITAQNGFPTMRGVGNYRVGNGGDGDLSPSSSMLKGQMSFSSGLPSSLGMLSRISEIEGDNVDDAKLGNGTGDAQFYASEYPFGSSWNNSMQFTENFTHLKRELEDDGKLFARTQNGDLRNRVPMLSHHLSLPKTSAEMDNLLQFQDSVPCKIRAKRGCATHPRSIAERVRRTRISERMRKLQELVPNMDKQTNTADMLDLAVDYIKNLQKQFKTLSDHRANCKCSSTQKSVPN